MGTTGGNVAVCQSVSILRARVGMFWGLLALLGTLTTTAQAADPDAVTYQNNAAHDGSATFQNFSSTPTKLWSVNLGVAVSYPLIAQGEIYVTAGDNRINNMTVYALNAATGHIDW